MTQPVNQTAPAADNDVVEIDFQETWWELLEREFWERKNAQAAA